MGTTLRLLASFLRLAPKDVANLSFLYFATFIMRAAAFAGVAVMQDVSARTLDALGRGLLFAVYPLAEIATVGYLGTLCDRVGRKRILVFAHLVTAAAVFLFIPSISSVVPTGVQPFLVAVCFVMFGVGAAAKVASTLAMINDHSSRANRAQLMAFFDLVTFGGLVGGFGAAFLALNAFGVSDATVLAVGGIGVTVSVVMVQFLVRETPFTPETQRGTLELLRTVLRNRDIQRLLPVYVPVVALYGYVITFTDNLLGAGSEGSATTTQLLIIVASMGLGLACFGGLAILLALAARPGGGADTAQLVSRWPLIAILAAGAGTFPPAALAYLGDVVGHAVTGTAFGIYSVIFGSGLIVGPVLGGALTQALGPLAFGVIALGLIGISGVGVVFIREPLKFPRTPMGPETVVPPGKR